MFDFLTNFNPGAFIGLVAVIGGMLVAVVTVIASQWRRVRLAEIEASLKQQMLEKGMSAADIALVIRARQKRGSSSRRSWQEHRHFRPNRAGSTHDRQGC